MSDPYRPARDEVAPGVPATEEVPRDVPVGWESEEQPPPLDFPQGATAWGVTPEEQRRGEPLDERRKHEEPDFPGRAPTAGVTIVDPSEDGYTDDEADLVGELDPDGEILGPEEAAMRIVDEPPGANYDADPGYVEDDLR
jgi:hypothetical protein